MDGKAEFLNLPSKIIINILSRLPTKTILQCRCLCKTFLNLLSDPEFIKLHLSRSFASLLIHHQDAFPREPNFSVIELEDELHPVMEFDLRKSIPHFGMISMVDSINGLLCLNDFDNGIVYVCNPITREYITLPKPDGARVYPNIVTYGFGLSSINGRYKVVRISQERQILDIRTGAVSGINKSECQIYILGSGPWRSIGKVPFLHNCPLHGVFLNGNLHWWIYDTEGSEFIYALDLEEEVFKPFPPPELSNENLGCLGVLGGRLCVCDNTSDFHISVWVMKEYGVKKSWTKDMVIEKSPALPVGQFCEVVYALKVLKDGEILFSWQEVFFFSYHPGTRTVNRIDICESNFEAKVLVPSFISLNNFVAEVVKRL